MASLMDAFDPAMLVFGGDTCNEGTWNSWTREFFLAEQQALNAEVPFANATGNHEGWNALTRAFTHAPGGDGNGYFSFDYGDAHFLILNTEVDYSPGSAQWDFAASDLSATTRPWKLVAYHKPAYCAGAHGEDAGMKAMSTQLFEPSGVAMTLTGHSHFYQHNLVNGIRHMVIGSTGAPLYAPGSASYTVYTEQTYCLGVFDMTATTLDMTTYREDGSVIETLHLERDLTPPSTPAGLSAAAAGHSQIDLTWTPASDPESGIDHYNVYRDGLLVGTTGGTDYGDAGLGELTTYSYEVSAVNGHLLEGARSAPASETTPADTTPPTLASVTGSDATHVEVVYSEPVEQTSAGLELTVTNPGNSLNLHRMLQGWAETDTWNSLVGGVQADDVEAAAAADASTGTVGTGTLSIDVAGSLAAWQESPSGNFGCGVLGNDSDPEEHPLTAAPLEDVSHGTLTLYPDGAFDYTPSPGYYGSDGFSYTVSDGHGGSDAGVLNRHPAPLLSARAGRGAAPIGPAAAPARNASVQQPPTGAADGPETLLDDEFVDLLAEWDLSVPPLAVL